MNEIENNESSVGEELTTFQKIITALEPLDKESRAKMLKMAATFFEIYLDSISATALQSKTQLGNAKSVPSFSEDRSLSPKEFVLEKQPHSDVEKVACLAYYLTHYRDTKYFKTIDISKLNTDAAQRKFSNAAKAVDNATRSGHLVQATQGQKQISAGGELYVQALPDRAAAREIIKKIRLRRKTKISTKMKNEEILT